MRGSRYNVYFLFLYFDVIHEGHTLYVVGIFIGQQSLYDEDTIKKMKADTKRKTIRTVIRCFREAVKEEKDDE